MTQPDTDGIFTVKFWKLSAERMVRAAAAFLGGTQLITIAGASVDWKKQLLGTAGAALASLVLSLAGSRIGDSSDPSLLKSPQG